MTRLGIRWLLSVLLAILPSIMYDIKQSCLAQPGGPPPPSPPLCHIPYEEYNGIAGRSAIQCVWDPGPPSDPPAIYTLHWKSADRRLEPLVIYWESTCSKQGLSEDHCQVRHQVAPDQPEEEEGFHGAYYLEIVRPYSLYKFEVRCACLPSLLSDWSPVYEVESPEAAPVGLLDLWSDCRTSPRSSECVLMWKRPPRWQAGGAILGYVVTLSHGDGTVTAVNASAAVGVPTDRLVCDEKRCYLNATLRDVTAVNVSAYTAHGATTPACLHMPLTCQFEKCIAYQVALFSVSPDGSSDHISSAVGYTHQGIPSKVPSFEVVTINTTSVKMTWEPIPLPLRRGVIVCYQIGVDSQRGYVPFALVMFVPCFVSFLLMKNFYWVFKKFIGLKKLPDPSNSHIFQNGNPLINGSWVHICLPVDMLEPFLSQLEIVEPCPDEMADRGSQGARGDVADQGDWAGSQNAARREECYSKMTDSDEETLPSGYEKRACLP
ncbi:hypothetical protein NHX12_031633 [Muraenolepis orangiensis]|uniref:Uncharacterized protein n=1 Tax=Muraenolepis orangiensis TaxID=630683 RepID=A0A9Q0IJV6_9TELE|nr:hypothetical protein NHX12_031633 [Muraenolepis orangiensis]